MHVGQDRRPLMQQVWTLGYVGKDVQHSTDSSWAALQPTRC